MNRLLTLVFALGWLALPNPGWANPGSGTSEFLSPITPQKAAPSDAAWCDDAESSDACGLSDRKAPEEIPPVLEEARGDEAPSGETAENAKDSKKCAQSLALRANLLRWATLTPDLGLEWRITKEIAVAVNGSWTSWSWKNCDRGYGLWEVMPEVRWYLGSNKRAYVGAMFKTGGFSYKLGTTGKQGDLIGGGFTGGYQLPLCRNLSMDFSLGLGYLKADYDKFNVIDGVRVRQGSETKNWWGPINAGISLVWKLF